MSGRFDVVVAGASVAGAATALLLAERGLRVLVADPRGQADAYKALCTHFVQPIALPVLRRLGLADEILAAGGVPTKAAFCTPAGRIDTPGPYYDSTRCAAGEAVFAINIERRVLDPLLLRRLGETRNVVLRTGFRVAEPRSVARGTAAVLVDGHERHEVEAALLVAADGRTSPLAGALGNAPVAEYDNQRACWFGYFEDVPAPPENRSLFLLGEREMAFLYPLGGGRALLSAYVPKGDRPGGDPAARAAALLALFARYPDAPDLARARLASPIYGYANYPGLRRRPAVEGTAFVGDAAMSLDPMSGVGCSFALTMADLLAEEVLAVARGGLDDVPHAALANYAARVEAFYPVHAAGIAGDSILAKSTASVASTYARIHRSPELQRLFIDLTGRLVMPAEFQRAFLRAGLQDLRRSG